MSQRFKDSNAVTATGVAITVTQSWAERCLASIMSVSLQFALQQMQHKAALPVICHFMCCMSCSLLLKLFHLILSCSLGWINVFTDFDHLLRYAVMQHQAMCQGNVTLSSALRGYNLKCGYHIAVTNPTYFLVMEGLSASCTSKQKWCNVLTKDDLHIAKLEQPVPCKLLLL